MGESIHISNADRQPVQRSMLDAVLEVWTQAGKQHYIPITGRSMLPLIRDGDHVLVAHGRVDVRRGDVIVFRYEGKLVAHRVLRIYKGETGYTFITKGDNTSQFDPPLNTSEIFGKVLAIKRGNRQMSIDTTAWRIMGWLIVVSTLVWVRWLSWIRYFVHKLFGFRSNCLTDFLLRGKRFSFLLIRKVTFAFFCRWKV